MSDRNASTIVVIGDRIDGSEPQEAIAPSLSDTAADLDVATPAVRWIGTEALADPRNTEGIHVLASAAGVWCAPGSPYRSFDGALAGIRIAREQGIPFLGTCAGFQHGVIEVARNVAGIASAEHEEYGREGGDLLIHELLCSLVGQRLDVDLVDDVVRDMYGKDRAEERYYCRFGLNPDHLPALRDAGFEVAGVDVSDGAVRILRLADHPWLVLTLFVPQTSSSPGAPHPLVRSFLAAAVAHARKVTA